MSISSRLAAFKKSTLPDSVVVQVERPKTKSKVKRRKNDVIGDHFDRDYNLLGCGDSTEEVEATEFKSLRRWQLANLQAVLTDGKKPEVARLTLTTAFCGSGKSINLIALACADSLTSPNRRQLFLVPQGHLAKSFHQEKIQLPWGNCTWELNDATNDIAFGAKTKTRTSKVEAIETWMFDKDNVGTVEPSRLYNNGLVATYQGFIRFWATLVTDEDKLFVLENLTISVDEAHHLNKLEVEDIDDCGVSQTERRQLAEIVNFAINNSPTTKIRLCTATPYRGDRAPIMFSSVSSQFVHYSLPWLEHFAGLGIETIRFLHEQYIVDPVDQIIDAVRAEPGQKHFIVIPPRNCKWRKNGELETLKSKLESIRYKDPKTKKVVGLRILDLVTLEGRDERKRFLMNEPKTIEGGSNVDVVIVCSLGREGLDWPCCSRLHNASVENSLTLAIQTLGRVFRSFGRKHTVVIRHYIKGILPIDSNTSLRELISDRLNCLIAAMTLDANFIPFVFPPLVEPKDPDSDKGTRGGTGGGGGGGGRKPVSLVEVFGDELEQVLIDFVTEYENSPDKSGKKTAELAREICDEYGIDEDITDNVVSALMLELRQASVGNFSCDLSFVRTKYGYDLAQIIAQHKAESVIVAEHDMGTKRILKEIVEREFAGSIDGLKEKILEAMVQYKTKLAGGK